MRPPGQFPEAMPAASIVSAHNSSQPFGELASFIVSMTEQGPLYADLVAMTDTKASEVAPNSVAASKEAPNEGAKEAGKMGGGLVGSSNSVESGDAISKDSANSTSLWMPVDKEAKLQVHRPSASGDRARMVGTRRHHGCKPT